MLRVLTLPQACWDRWVLQTREGICADPTTVRHEDMLSPPKRSSPSYSGIAAHLRRLEQTKQA